MPVRPVSFRLKIGTMFLIDAKIVGTFGARPIGQFFEE